MKAMLDSDRSLGPLGSVTGAYGAVTDPYGAYGRG